MTTKTKAKPTLAEMNALAMLFNQNKIAEAEPLAVRMTQCYPKHVYSWKALGAVRQEQGLLDDAVKSLQIAAELMPEDSEVHYNLGNCFYDQRQLTKAVTSYQKAVKLAPGFAMAHFNLANVLKDQGQLGEAEASYRIALKIDPKNALMHFNLAQLCYAGKRFEEAVNHYQHIIKIKPDYAAAHLNLGVTFKEMGQFLEAEACYRKALNLNPNYALAYNNLGIVLKELGRFAEAETCYRNALNIKQDFAEAYNNLGLVLECVGRSSEAEDAFAKALELAPADASMLSNFSLTLNAQSQLSKAEAYQKKALQADPQFVDSYINLGLNYLDQGRVAEAEACYSEALQIQPDCLKAKSGLLFAMNYSTKHSVEACLAQASGYGHMVAEQTKAVFTSWPNISPAKRLRVGLVSGDLRQHAVAHFLENVIEHIDASNIELIAYPTDGREDEMSARLKPYFSAWKPLVGLNDDEAAQVIHSDGVQILLDLSGHSAGNRLPVFARKPAPVQVSWLGYFATTGLSAMDYFIADEVGVPQGNQRQFVEKIKYLPKTRLCFTAPEAGMEISPLPALENGYITFGCFQNMAKVGDDVLALWAQVMNAVPNARLRFQSKALGDLTVAKRIIERLKHSGINPNKVTMYGFESREGYLAAHADVDVILDTFPFPGGTTTCEALWMGVPTLTLAGNTLIARQGASLLTAAGLGDWVADNITDFVSRALLLTGDLKQLANLRANLRAQVLTSPLFDGQLFAGNMEKALWEMWRDAQPMLTNEEKMNKQHAEVQYQPLTKEAHAQKLKNNLKRAVHIVSATRYTEQDFWNKSALGQSLKKRLGQDSRLSAKVAFENSRGLSEVFNDGIEQADDEAVLVFIHDDVWLDEPDFADTVIAGLEYFDVIGVAGNKRRVPGQPAWAFIDAQFTWDERVNLSGRVAHGENALGEISDFGVAPAECELMDGVFLAARKSTLKPENVRFDPQFDFHFYDMDFCRSARLAGLRLGTWLVRLTHQSGGAFGTPSWAEKYQLYLNKWEGADINNHELQAAMQDVLNLAVEHQQAGRLEQAELLYQEILKIQPEHAEANHNLGVIEAHAKSVLDALPRLELAVQKQPENEQFWVSYIDALMQSGATDSAIDALELGQQYGLKPETAQALAAEFVNEMESGQHSQQAESQQNALPPYTITTLIPAYKTQFIPQLLLSLATQTFKHFKVIVADDSPNNEVTALINSPELSELLSYLDIQIIDGPKKGGYPNIFNLVGNYAHQAEFFHILMDDDLIYPTFYETHMREHARVSANVSISARWTANQFGQPLSLPMDESTSQYFLQQFDAASIFKAVVPTCNNKLGEWSHAVFRREAADCILNPYIKTVSYFGLDDLGSFINATIRQSGIWIPTPLGFFRTHNAQNTAQLNNATIKCAHYAWVAFAIVGVENQWISRNEAWECICTIRNTIRARYSQDALGMEMLAVLNGYHEYSTDFQNAFLVIWNRFLKEFQLQKVLDGDVTIQLL